MLGLGKLLFPPRSGRATLPDLFRIQDDINQRTVTCTPCSIHPTQTHRADRASRPSILAHVATPEDKFPYIFLGGGETLKSVIDLLSQHFVMFNYIGSSRGSAPLPYTGLSPSFPSPARILYQRNPGYHHGTPPNTPHHRQHGFESTTLPYGEGTRRRRGVIPPYGTGPNNLKRPSRVFSDHRSSVCSTLFDPPEKDPSYSPPLYEDPGGIDRFKDEDEINFNILRQ